MTASTDSQSSLYRLDVTHKITKAFVHHQVMHMPVHITLLMSSLSLDALQVAMAKSRPGSVTLEEVGLRRGCQLCHQISSHPFTIYFI